MAKKRKPIAFLNLDRDPTDEEIEAFLDAIGVPPDPEPPKPKTEKKPKPSWSVLESCSGNLDWMGMPPS